MSDDEIGLTNEFDTDRARRLWSETSFAIAILGWLIIGATLDKLIFNSFPLQLAAPEWQLSLIAAFLTACFPLLVGALLIALAPLFNPAEQILQNWRRAMGRFVGLFVVLIVLFIPLQFFSGSRALHGQTAKALEALSNLKGIAQKVNAIDSVPELRVFFASLPNPPSLPDKLDAPFPVIKQSVIQGITAQINAVSNNIDNQKSEALQIFLKEAIRNTSQFVLWGAAFSALANLSGNPRNVVTRLFGIFL